MDPGPPKRRSIQASIISENGRKDEEEEEEEADGINRNDQDEGRDPEEDDEDDDDEVEEPKLKYSRLTEYLSGVYRNGDATSTFLVSGDKMV